MTRMRNRCLLKIENPTTLTEFERFVLEKTTESERFFYIPAIKALKRKVRRNQKINYITKANFPLSKTGFIVLTDRHVIIVTQDKRVDKYKAVAIKYKNIESFCTKSIDKKGHGILDDSGILTLQVKTLFRDRKKAKKIYNIYEDDLVELANIIKERTDMS